MTSTLIGCAARDHSRVKLEVVHALGGPYRGACLSGSEVTLSADFEEVTLTAVSARVGSSVNSGDRLKVTRTLYLPIAHDIDAHASHSSERGDELRSSEVRLASARRCSDTERLPISASGALSAQWAGRQLRVTHEAWRWGEEQRTRLIEPRDIAALVERSIPRDGGSSRAYMIASESGLWRWRWGGRHALREPLPSGVPTRLTRVIREGSLWWVHTLDHDHRSRGTAQDTADRDVTAQSRTAQGVHSARALAWPINLMSHPPQLISAPRSAPSRSKHLLAPLMGSALTGELGGLSLRWREVSYPTPPLSALCVLSPQLIAVATSSDVRILSGRVDGTAELVELTRLSLPRPTHALLCEAPKRTSKRLKSTSIRAKTQAGDPLPEVGGSARVQKAGQGLTQEMELIMLGGYGLLTARVTAQVRQPN